MSKKAILLSLVVLTVFTKLSAQQKDSLKAPWWVEKYKVTAGGFVPISNTDLKVSATGADHTIGTEVDLEHDLGFNRSNGTFLLDLEYRLTRRSRFDLAWYQLNRSASKTLDKDIVFNEDTFHVNNTVSAFFNTGMYRFSYGYGIFETPKFELGLSFGFHIMHTSAGISSVGTNASLTKSTNFGFTAPLPDFGIWGGYALSDRWAINGEFDYFTLTVGDVNGRVLGANVAVTYRVYKKLNVSLGYTGFNFKVDVTKTRAFGSFQWGFNGPSLTASYSFGSKSWTSH